jgi:hypothetical protein
MRIVVPLHKDPLLSNKIVVTCEGKEKKYSVRKEIVIVPNKEVVYIVPDSFPLPLVKVIFGCTAKVEK